MEEIDRMSEWNRNELWKEINGRINIVEREEKIKNGVENRDRYMVLLCSVSYDGKLSLRLRYANV